VSPNVLTVTGLALNGVACAFFAFAGGHGYVRPDLLRVGGLVTLLAAVFDMLDGRVARMTRTQSAFGLQLDSLADVVSFGVAPAVLMYNWSLKQMPTLGLVISFLFVAAGAVRLARFNVCGITNIQQKTRGKEVKQTGCAARQRLFTRMLHQSSHLPAGQHHFNAGTPTLCCQRPSKCVRSVAEP
jgi:CDP-diacylglycerol--serine O-phosphatidyltransferase